MKISLNWLRDFITIPPQHGKLAEDLTMAGLTVEGIHETNFEARDTVFETEVTTNRPDWLSHWGVAREAAAVMREAVEAAEEGDSPTPPMPPRPPLPPMTGGKLVTGTLNGGGPDIQVATMNGDVTLRKLEPKK